MKNELWKLTVCEVKFRGFGTTTTKLFDEVYDDYELASYRALHYTQTYPKTCAWIVNLGDEKQLEIDLDPCNNVKQRIYINGLVTEHLNN